MAQQDYSGLTVGLRFIPDSDKFWVEVEVEGGRIPIGQVSEAKFNKYLALTQPPPQPAAPPAAVAPVAAQPQQ